MSRISSNKGLTAGAIRKLRNADKQRRKAQVEAMNKANDDVVKAREGQDDTTRLVQSVMKGARADNRLTSTASRDKLKSGTTTAGFQGPRGFHTPKGTVTAAENKPGQLSPRALAPLPGGHKQRFAVDGYDTPKADGEGSVMKLGKPFKAKGTRKLQRRFETLDLNDGNALPTDAALARSTDRAYRDERTAALAKGQSITFAAKLRKA